MKKIVVYMLAFVLVIGMINVTLVAKANTYTEVTLTGTDVHDSKVNGDQWAIFFTTSGFSSTDWSRKYEGFTFEVNGVSGVTGQASAADANRLYCTIPTSVLPNIDGTEVTIKAGQYDSDGGESTVGIHIKNDIKLVVSEGTLVCARVLEAVQVETFHNTANSFYFTLKDANGTYISTGFETWDNFLSPAQPNGARVEQSDWTKVYSGVFVDGNVITYSGWPNGTLEFKNYEVGNFYVGGLNAKNGTTVVIKGMFASSTQSTWDEVGRFFFKELTFIYDGSKWSVMKETVDTQYKGTPVFSHAGSGAAGFYFKAGETAFPYDADSWSVKAIANDDAESGVFVNGTKTEVYVKKVGQDAWYVCMSDKGVVPEANDIITIKGVFTYESHSITFKEGKFIFDGNEYKAYKEPEPEVEVQYTEGTITGFDKNVPPTHNGAAWVLYLKVSSSLLGGAWDDGGTYPIRANINGGSEFTPTVKSAGGNTLYVEISTTGLLETDDITVTLKAGTYVKSKEAYGLVLEEDFVFYVTKYGFSTSDALLSKNVVKRNWTLTESHSNVGFYVQSNAADSLPVGGWDIQYSLEDSNVTFQKLDEYTSFVNVSGLGAQEGVPATYIIGGLVYNESNQRYVQYEPIKIHWDGATWTQLSNPYEDSKVDADVNGDAKVSIRDLMRYKRYWKNPLLSINEERADVNYDGTTDAYDVVSLRKVLSGEFHYRSESERADIPYGIPCTFISFEKIQTLQLAAGATNSNTTDSRLVAVSATGGSVTIGCMDSKDGIQAYEVTAGQTASVTFTFAYATDVLVKSNDKTVMASAAEGVYTCSVAAGETVCVIPVRVASVEELVDFVVEVDDEPVVLHITDTQIIDSAQDVDGALGGVQITYSAPERMDENCFDYLDELIEKTNPDFIIMTGDNVYGRFDDNGTSFRRLIDFMESKQIPWAPVWGNHDSETEVTDGSLAGIDVYCKWLEDAEYCMFKQRKLTGNSNYTVGIKQGDEVTRVFFMVDSNGIGSPSDATMANGHTTTDFGFAQDQVAWYTKTAETINRIADVKYSFAFHIPLAAFTDAYAQYGYTNGRGNAPINIDTHEERREGDFGYLGSGAYEWDTSRMVYDGFKKIGVDSIFVGHEHTNSASVVYEGIRFQYGQKSSTYDALNFIDLANGNVKSAECNTTLTPLVGGTVLPLAEDGSIVNPHIYMVGFENGVVDWDEYQ